MSNSNVTVEFLGDRVVITQTPPSGRKCNAAIVEIDFKQWFSLNDAVIKALKDRGEL